MAKQMFEFTDEEMIGILAGSLEGRIPSPCIIRADAIATNGPGKKGFKIVLYVEPEAAEKAART